MDQSQNDGQQSMKWMDLPLSEIASLLNIVDLHLFVQAAGRIDWGREEVRVFMESMAPAKRNKFLAVVIDWAERNVRKELAAAWDNARGG